MSSLFPIIAIGASAGGLNAFQCFLAALPREFAFAVVFMQHLSPKHENHLPDLVRKGRPDLDSREISNGLEVLPGKIYLCPPGKEIKILKESFLVSDPPEDHVHLPIDEFFISLAEVIGERAVAVIFSGAGTDGARGVKAIRNAGGTVFVQDPETAEFPEMPAAVINAGQADAALPPDEIAREIQKLYGSGVVAAPGIVIAPEEFDALYRLIQDKTGLRFHHYKQNVVSRRIRRRMYLRAVSSVQDYIAMVDKNDLEAAHLVSDLMIGVTSFFRDRLAWKALRIGVIRKLAAEDEDQPVRVWCPACATGEEAYSIAMMLRYEFELLGRRREIQIFATDVNDRALEKAREGKYPATIAADLPPDCMKRFFTCSKDGLSVSIGKEIRESVVFARQDLLTDPPFSRLDLIICRNFMIYLEPEAQEKCITLFHYALKDGGYLFLGNAESVGRSKTLFRTLPHKKCRIYQKVETKAPSRLMLSVPFASERVASAPGRRTAIEHQQSANEFIQEALLEKYAPAAVAIDQHYNIVYHNGPTNRYLIQPRGTPTQNILELFPEGLRNKIRGAIYRVTQETKPISIRAVLSSDDGLKRQVILRISKARENLFLVVFREKAGIPEETEVFSLEAGQVDETAVRQIESELSSTRAELQSNIEQLKGLNEELQSSNEELQAANEELETSREELQSLNEELITVNSQLQCKIEEQEETNNDLNNFLFSTNIPTVFLDQQFRVKRFTPAMSRLLKLIPSDVGRPIIDMSQENLGPDLIADAQAVLDNLAPVKNEFAVNGNWYIRAALPYRTSDNRIEGVVITYTDVSDLKRAEERTRHLASFPQLNPNPVIEVDSSGGITFSNAATQRVLEDLSLDREDASVFLPYDMDGILGVLKKNEEIALYREVAIKDRVFGETIYVAPLFSAVRIYTFDVTERKWTERAMEARLRIAEAAYKGALSADDVLRLTLDELELQTGSKIGFYHFLEEDQETLSLRNWSTNTVAKMCNAEGSGSHYNISQAGVWVDCVRERRPVIHNDYASLSHKKGMPTGHAPVIREMVVPIFRGGLIVAIIGVGNKETDYTDADIEMAKLLGDFSWEIVERKRAEEEILHAKEEWERTFASVPDMIAIIDNNHRVVRVNESMAKRLGCRPEDCVGLKCYEALHGTSAPPSFCPHTQTLKDGGEHVQEVHEERLGMDLLITTTPLFDDQGKMVGSVHVAHDITERKRAEQEREVSLKFLHLINMSTRTPDLIESAATFFQEQSGCEAVGIRLKEGDDYPYCEARGFPKEFVKMESSLCSCDESGNVVRDDWGNPVLACMCGNVICGRFDPSRKFFSKGGSFWTNSTTELLASTTETDRRARTRNRCNGEGYESVALMPLRMGAEPLGLVQLNDKRKGMFSPEVIALWERLSGYLSVALAKTRAEEELRRRVEELRLANEELTRFNSAAVGRELRMIELKKEINELSARADKPQRYRVDFEEEERGEGSP
ncbi:MAG TPA: CheR family methyltransferase [Thermodesulfovibrionales bacterium]|nr:CheR family methyltransferase [Thermodesulfovibrionales bacterium]